MQLSFDCDRIRVFQFRVYSSNVLIRCKKSCKNKEDKDNDKFGHVDKYEEKYENGEGNCVTLSCHVISVFSTHIIFNNDVQYNMI